MSHNNIDPVALNLYDVIFNGFRDGDWSQARDLASIGSIRIFNNRNCGYQELTNLQASGQVPDYRSALITNWYARTNIAPCEALDQWAHSTMVKLEVGCWPVAQLNLYDLLRRPQGALLPDEVVKDNALLDMSIARRAVSAYGRVTGSRHALFDLPADQREAWMAVAEEMRRLLSGPPTISIPTRQNFGVQIEGSSEAFAKLQSYVTLLPLLEGRFPLPAPRAWIHLEGVGFFEDYDR